jgi:hypothetical protein
LARKGLWVLLLALAVGVAGCGEEGGAGGEAVGTVYVSSPDRLLCDEAREQASQGKGGEEPELRVVCLDAGPKGEWTLAQVGANARRATEDSTAVAYVGEPERKARRQSQPILEAAGIATFGSANGREAVAEVRAALRETEGADPRQAVLDAVEG